MFKKIKFRSLLGNSWVLLLLAALVAGGLTFVLYKYLTDREAKLKDEMAARQVRAGIAVVVPMRDVPVGTPLSSSDFVSREIAQDLVYDDMIKVDDFPTYRAAHLIKAVKRGLPLRASDIDGLRGRDFSDILPPGQRALTLEIDMINSTASMVRPGNRVDIYWVGKVTRKGADSSDDTKLAQLVMQNVLVLATGQDVKPRDASDTLERDSGDNAMGQHITSNYGTVTLQVPVDEAPRIILAQKVGMLRLILRNSEDQGANTTPVVTENNLFAGPSEKGTAMPGTGPVVEVISGGNGAQDTTLIPGVGPSTAPNAQPAAPAPAQPAPTAQSAPAGSARQQSLYEQANAIAQQLQKADARGTSGRN